MNKSSVFLFPCQLSPTRRVLLLTLLHNALVLSDIESSAARNRSSEELKKIVDARLKTYLPLSQDSYIVDTDSERKKDIYSHFVLRLAFCRS